MNKYTLLTYVMNKPGVLHKVSSLIRRKMYNIDTLTVSDTGDTSISGITITLTTDNFEDVQKIMQQVMKLPEVISIKNLDPETSYWRELAIIKCNLKDFSIEQLSNKYQIEVLYNQESSNLVIIQIAGRTRDLDMCISDIGDKNILDITRTGVTAMERENVSPDYTFKSSASEINKKTNF